MISITFQLDETQDLKPQIHRALEALGLGTTTYTAPIQIVATPASATVTIETEEVVPAKRGRKAKDTVAAKAPVTETVIPEVNDQDAADEAAEASSDVLTHDDVRTAVGIFTKRFGIVAAQKKIPEILGCAIADLPDDQAALQKAITSINEFTDYVAQTAEAMSGFSSTKEPVKAAETNLFDDVGEPEDEITEQDVRDALMVYAKKYDVDDKMVNTLIDGPDILKKTFGPTVTALRLMPKDPASLKKAYDAITDATENNWYNRKVQA